MKRTATRSQTASAAAKAARPAGVALLRRKAEGTRPKRTPTRTPKLLPKDIAQSIGAAQKNSVAVLFPDAREVIPGSTAGQAYNVASQNPSVVLRNLNEALRLYKYHLDNPTQLTFDLEKDGYKEIMIADKSEVCCPEGEKPEFAISFFHALKAGALVVDFKYGMVYDARRAKLYFEKKDGAQMSLAEIASASIEDAKKKSALLANADPKFPAKETDLEHTHKIRLGFEETEACQNVITPRVIQMVSSALYHKIGRIRALVMRSRFVSSGSNDIDKTNAALSPYVQLEIKDSESSGISSSNYTTLTGLWDAVSELETENQKNPAEAKMISFSVEIDQVSGSKVAIMRPTRTRVEGPLTPPKPSKNNPSDKISIARHMPIRNIIAGLRGSNFLPKIDILLNIDIKEKYPGLLTEEKGNTALARLFARVCIFDVKYQPRNQIVEVTEATKKKKSCPCIRTECVLSAGKTSYDEVKTGTMLNLPESIFAFYFFCKKYGLEGTAAALLELFNKTPSHYDAAFCRDNELTNVAHVSLSSGSSRTKTNVLSEFAEIGTTEVLKRKKDAIQAITRARSPPPTHSDRMANAAVAAVRRVSSSAVQNNDPLIIGETDKIRRLSSIRESTAVIAAGENPKVLERRASVKDGAGADAVRQLSQIAGEAGKGGW